MPNLLVDRTHIHCMWSKDIDSKQHIHPDKAQGDLTFDSHMNASASVPQTLSVRNRRSIQRLADVKMLRQICGIRRSTYALHAIIIYCRTYWKAELRYSQQTAQTVQTRCNFLLLFYRRRRMLIAA